MGIKHFYGWMKKHPLFKKYISVYSVEYSEQIDHLLIDMNGIIHEAAQKVYQYGKYKSFIILPKRKIVNKPDLKLNYLYSVVKEEVLKIIKITKPKKTIFLAIDGVAPKSKQNQQRQRRFRAAQENSFSNFDSSCITAGTEFMSLLSKNLMNDKTWLSEYSEVKIIISSDSEPGEGEHKLIDWVRHYKKDETFCVVGMDADLILLCLTLDKSIFIMRKNEYNNTFDFIDIKSIKKNLPVKIEDLIIWSCFIGNDFLPQIPSLEIRESDPEEGALDFFFREYKDSLIKNNVLNNFEIVRLLKLVSEREQNIMDARNKDNERFCNSLWNGNIEHYRKEYHKEKLNNTDLTQLVYHYMKTVYWVFLYYTKGIKSWDWFYPYNYAVHADDFVKYMPKTSSFKFKSSQPSHPYEQLLRVIPLKSKNVVPACLHEEMERIAKKYTTFKIDKSGKRQEWEAVTIVDFVNPILPKIE